jgi:hypothetical protein
VFTLESTCGGGKFYLIAAFQSLNFAATMAGGVFWVSENWFHLPFVHWTTTIRKLQQATNPSTPSRLGVFVFCPFLLNVVEVVFIPACTSRTPYSDMEKRTTIED